MTFWGVRGSIPTPEDQQARFGGNTPCVSVEVPGGPVLALDGGLGLRWMALDLLGERSARGQAVVHLLLTHFHWDHIQGIPFCPLMHVPGNRVILYGRPGSEGSLKRTLLHQMDPSYCPVPNFLEREHVGATLEYREIRGTDRFSIEGLEVRARELPHGRWNTCSGFRIERAGKAVAFLTDVEYPEDDPTSCPAALELARGADLLIHDAQFLPEESPRRRGWGHSNHIQAAALGRAAGCRQVALFHYDPARTDEELEVIESLYRDSDPPVFCAREGMVLEL